MNRNIYVFNQFMHDETDQMINEKASACMKIDKDVLIPRNVTTWHSSGAIEENVSHFADQIKAM